MIPLSTAWRARLSPQAVEVDRALRLTAAPPSLAPHAISLDVESTAWAVALGASYLGLFWCARAIFSRGGIRTTTRGVTWIGLALTTLVAVQRATSPTLLYWHWRPLSPNASPYGPFVNRNSLATWLAMAVPLVIGYAMARHQSRPRTGGVVDMAGTMDSTQVWLGGAAVLMTGGLIGSLSRAGILGGAVSLIAFVVMSRKRMTNGRSLAWMVAGLTAMVAIASVYANLGALAMRMQETTEQGEWGRPAIWRDTWRMTRDFWLTGVGAGAYQQGMLVYQQSSRLFFFNHAHDEYLQLIAEGGLLVGVPAAIAVLAAATLMVTRLRTDRSAIFWVRAGAVSGMIAVAVQSIWDTGLRIPANGALFAVMAAIALHEPHGSHSSYGSGLTRREHRTQPRGHVAVERPVNRDHVADT
jgi:O-antigen ligase